MKKLKEQAVFACLFSFCNREAYRNVLILLDFILML